MFVKHCRKEYAVQERLSGEWGDRWSGFKSQIAANRFMRKMNSIAHGALRVVKITREIM